MSRADVWHLLESTLERFLKDPAPSEQIWTALGSDVPADQRDALTAVLETSQRSYRDAVLIQLAHALLSPGMDTRVRPTGARGIAGKLGRFFTSKHIPSVADAYQNIGKN